MNEQTFVIIGKESQQYEGVNGLQYVCDMYYGREVKKRHHAPSSSYYV